MKRLIWPVNTAEVTGAFLAVHCATITRSASSVFQAGIYVSRQTCPKVLKRLPDTATCPEPVKGQFAARKSVILSLRFVILS